MSETLVRGTCVPLDWWTCASDAITRHCQRRTRYMRCQATRDDLLAESLALGWQRAVRLFSGSTRWIPSPGFMARYSVASALRGHRLCGASWSDAVGPDRSPRAEPSTPPIPLNDVSPGLLDGTHGPRRRPCWSPADAARLRIDLDAYLSSCTPRTADILGRLIQGWTPPEIARQLGIHVSRVYALRSQTEERWTDYAV